MKRNTTQTHTTMEWKNNNNQHIKTQTHNSISTSLPYILNNIFIYTFASEHILNLVPHHFTQLNTHMFSYSVDIRFFLYKGK